jgi:hypothetical protein
LHALLGAALDNLGWNCNEGAKVMVKTNEKSKLMAGEMWVVGLDLNGR